MVILFILIGAFFGGIAASLVLVTGGSMLMAIAFYSIFGTLASLVCTFAIYLYQESAGKTADWSDTQKPTEPVSI